MHTEIKPNLKISSLAASINNISKTIIRIIDIEPFVGVISYPFRILLMAIT